MLKESNSDWTCFLSRVPGQAMNQACSFCCRLIEGPLHPGSVVLCVPRQNVKLRQAKQRPRRDVAAPIGLRNNTHPGYITRWRLASRERQNARDVTGRQRRVKKISALAQRRSAL